MSNKTQLSNNNTKLASLIQELQGKAAGGGASVEMCTVTISNAGNYIAVLYPTYENGMFTPNYASCNYGASPAPFDIPKGHVIYIITGEGHTYLDAENAEIIFNITDGHAGWDMMGIRVTGDVTITE